MVFCKLIPLIYCVVAAELAKCLADSILTMEKKSDFLLEENISLRRVAREADNGSGTDGTDSTLRKSTDVHIFANDSNPSISLIWSGRNGVILALTTASFTGMGQSRLYRSTNYGGTFIDISDKIHNDRIMGSHGLLVSPVDSEHVILMKDVISIFSHSVLYVSRDSGETFERAVLGFNIKTGSISFNSLNSLRLLAISRKDSGLWLSYDFGLVWRHISDKVVQVKWDPLESSTFYYTKDPTGLMLRGGFSNELYRCTTDTMKCTKVAEHVYSFGIQGGFLFISVEYLNHNGSRVMHVSKNGGVTWDAAQIPLIGGSQFYSILDMSEEMVFVHVDSAQGKGDGTVYSSAEKGIIYSQSLKDHLYPNMGSLTDFYKVSSLPGVYITSQLEHVHDTIHSMITFDKGGTWQKIDAPKGSVCPKTEVECKLQIHSLFSKSKGVEIPDLPKSTQSATGIIIAHGNIGDALNFNPPDVYVSNDGGYTWMQPSVLKGPHFYAIGDSGGLLYAVSSKATTNTILYSTDEGDTWEEYDFTDKPIKVTGLSVEPGSRSTVLGLWGWDKNGDGAWRSFSVDFRNILRPCVKEDYEQWKAHESNTLYSDDKCLLGSNVNFLRKKKGTKCQNGKEFMATGVFSPCDCTATDYLCDYGYKRNAQMKCVLDDNFQNTHLDVCMRGEEEMIETKGYRKIPGDKCVDGFSPDTKKVPLRKSCIPIEKKKDDFGVDKTKFTAYEPPNRPSTTGTSHTGLIAFLVIVVLGLGAGLIFLIRKKNLTGRRVKYVPLSSSEHVTNSDETSTSLLDDDDYGNSSKGQYSAVRQDIHSGQESGFGKAGISYHDDSDEDMLIS